MSYGDFSKPLYFYKKCSVLSYNRSCSLNVLIPLQIGFIGRLDYQKGIDLIQTAGPDLMVDDIQFVSESIERFD